jgi:4-amino-4-deoxy-L-arabinose transferase-like glycosyltransferase
MIFSGNFSRSAEKWIIGLIGLLYLTSVLLPIGLLELRYEESRRGLVTLEMLLTGDYIVPKLHGWVYLNKPPLFNWAIAGLAKISGGLNDSLVRLPSLVALFLVAWLHWSVASRYVSRQAALLSSLLFLTIGDIYFFETVISGEIDLFYTLLVYAQAICVFSGYQQRNFVLLFTGSYLFMTAGILTKGLPSVVFQALTLAGWAAWNRKWKWLAHPWHFVSLLIPAGLLGWYGHAYAQQADLGTYVSKLFMEASEKSGLESSWVEVILSPLTYPLFLAKFLAPWTLLLPFALIKKTRREFVGNPFTAFALVFTAVNILPYMLTAHAKSRYIYMFFPFITLILVQGYLQAGEQFKKYRLFLEGLVQALMALVIFAIPVMLFVSPVRSIPGAWVSLLPWAVLKLAAWVYFRQEPHQRLFVFILFICLVRFVFNAVYYPLVAASAGHDIKKHAARMTELTAGEQVNFFARPDSIHFSSKSPFFSTVSEPVLTPPYIRYTIPYYLSMDKKEVIPFDTTLQANQIYLAPVLTPIPADTQQLYRFTDHSKKLDYVLFRVWGSR